MISPEHELVTGRMAELQAQAAAASRVHRFAVARRAARRAERTARRATRRATDL
jgi:hypothetical protein